MNVRHHCQMAQLLAEEMEFEQGWNSLSHTRVKSNCQLQGLVTLTLNQKHTRLGGKYILNKYNPFLLTPFLMKLPLDVSIIGETACCIKT